MDASRMNDTQEVHFGLSVVEGELAKLKPTESDTSPYRDMWQAYCSLLASVCADWASNPCATQSYGRVYLASLSKDGDSLGQWRGYCPSSGGYALGFDPARLQLAADPEVMFPECVYGPDKSREAIRDVVNDMQSDLGRLRTSDNHIVTQYIKGIRLDKSLNRSWVKSVSRLKHWGFREEQEVLSLIHI
jgi:hypothetical protein